MKLLKRIKFLLNLFSKNKKFKVFDTYQNAISGGKDYNNDKLIKVTCKIIKYSVLK